MLGTSQTWGKSTGALQKLVIPRENAHLRRIFCGASVPLLLLDIPEVKWSKEKPYSRICHTKCILHDNNTVSKMHDVWSSKRR